MIHIAICDDEKDFVQHLTGLVEHYSKESGEPILLYTLLINPARFSGGAHWSPCSSSVTFQPDLCLHTV